MLLKERDEKKLRALSDEIMYANDEDEKRPSMVLDSVEAGVSRLKSLLYAAEIILVGNCYLEADELDSLKDIVDMCSECVRGVEEKLSE